MEIGIRPMKMAEVRINLPVNASESSRKGEAGGD